MKSRLGCVSLSILSILLMSCTIHIKPEKFDIDPQLTRGLSGNIPIQVIVPKNAEPNYLIEFSGSQHHPDVYVDLNVLYRNAKELIEEALVENQVPLLPDSPRFLKFAITKIQWELWAWGFSIGSYLEFDVETGDGYKGHYREQDGSSAHVSRAVGGTVSRAVERIFQDEKVLSYIKSSTSD